MDELRGRVAVITGAGSGIGEALAHACAAESMRVVVADIEADEAERVAGDLRAGGAEALAVAVDVTDRGSVEALADRAYEAFGAVHLLCNNAGVLSRAPIVETTDGDWRWNMGVNFFGAIHGVQAFVPRMIAGGEPGHVVNTASIGGLVPPAVHPSGAYTASKYAVVGMTETLRRELEPSSIGVSVLCPAGVHSRIFRATRNRQAEFGGPSEEDSDSSPNPVRLQPEGISRTVLNAVRENRLYIVTHPETRELVEQRFQAILEAYDLLGARSES